MSLQLLAFDCDGIILESMDVKSDAYARLAEPFGPEAMDRIRVFHALSGGVNRLAKGQVGKCEFCGAYISEKK